MAELETHRVSRKDRFGLWCFVAFGVVMAAVSVIGAIARIVEVLPNEDVTVTADFAGTAAQAPIGPDGSEVAVELDRAVLTVPSLPGASVGAIVIQQVVLAVGVIVVVWCLTLLVRNMAAGRIFSARSTRYATGASVAGFVTYASVPFFGNMAANGAFARLSDRTFENVVMSANIGGLVLAGFLAALASTVFAVGDRVRRDTEGLI